MESQSPLASVIAAFKQGRTDAQLERKARQLRYDSRLVESFNYSPQEFYTELARNIEKREIPGISVGIVSFAESIIGSANRLYLAVAREKLRFFICAAPFGSGFFLSWRFVDERRPAEWYHLVAAVFLWVGLSGFIMFALQWITSSFLLALSAPILIFAFFLSLMRLGALPGNEQLAMTIESTPILGRIFERFYRPDTYYREDTTKMYEKAFYYAIVDTIETVTGAHGSRNQVRVPESSIIDK